MDRRKIDPKTLTVKWQGGTYGPPEPDGPTATILRAYVDAGGTHVLVSDGSAWETSVYHTATLWHDSDRYKWLAYVQGPRTKLTACELGDDDEPEGEPMKCLEPTTAADAGQPGEARPTGFTLKMAEAVRRMRDADGKLERRVCGYWTTPGTPTNANTLEPEWSVTFSTVRAMRRRGVVRFVEVGTGVPTYELTPEWREPQPLPARVEPAAERLRAAEVDGRPTLSVRYRPLIWRGDARGNALEKSGDGIAPTPTAAGDGVTFGVGDLRLSVKPNKGRGTLPADPWRWVTDAERGGALLELQGWLDFESAVAHARKLAEMECWRLTKWG